MTTEREKFGWNEGGDSRYRRPLSIVRLDGFVWFPLVRECFAGPPSGILFKGDKHWNELCLVWLWWNIPLWVTKVWTYNGLPEHRGMKG